MVIRSEPEYQEARRRLEQDREVAARQREALAAAGLPADQVERAMQPLLSFQAQLAEEIEWYEHVCRRSLPEMRWLIQLGRLLIALRIADGLTQRELAERLEVSESVVSRDERNEYHGITLERAQRVLDALGETVAARVEEPSAEVERRVLAGVGKERAWSVGIHSLGNGIRLSMCSVKLTGAAHGLGLLKQKSCTGWSERLRRASFRGDAQARYLSIRIPRTFSLATRVNFGLRALSGSGTGVLTWFVSSKRIVPSASRHLRSRELSITQRVSFRLADTVRGYTKRISVCRWSQPRHRGGSEPRLSAMGSDWFGPQQIAS